MEKRMMEFWALYGIVKISAKLKIASYPGAGYEAKLKREWHLY